MVEVVNSEDIVELEGDALMTEHLRRGSRLGRYELLLPIAKGGMARVWAARQHGQRGFSKIVAIKTILPHLAQEPEFERMFLDEAKIAALIHHPNVCEIYELAEEGKVLYLAMEWVNGESLMNILRSSGKVAPMDARLAARIVADACAGLHAAHQLTDDDGKPMNVVHRDVSPHNILVASDGTAKVADFGVAKALGQMHSATQAGQLKGKLAYMAPEQVTGNAIDRRSDIFSMGCCLYEATTGSRPFVGTGDAAVMHAVLQGQFTPPSRIVRGYSPELEQIVIRALATDVNARFQTAERMRTALEEWLAQSGSIVTQSHVGNFVTQRVGGILDKRRERIKQATAASAADEASHPGAGIADQGHHTPSVHSGVNAIGSRSALPASPPTSGSFSQAPVPEAQPTPTSKYVMAGAIGVAVACMIGIVGVMLLRNKNVDEEVRAAPIVTNAASHPTQTAAPVTAAPIKFDVTPASAVLIIEGVVQDGQVREVARPTKGTSILVVVHATDYDDQTFALDDTSQPMSVTLVHTIAPTAQASASAAPTVKKVVVLPPNPY